MDQGRRGNGEENPRKTANILSIITFFYNFPIIKKGKKKDLEERDIYKVLPNLEAQKLGEKFELQWERGRKGKKYPSLWICLWKSFGWTYICYGIIQLLFGTAIILLQPIIFSKFVAYFQPDQKSIILRDVYLYALGVIGLNLLNSVFGHNLTQLVVEYSMKVRTAVCSLIFRKALKVTPVAFSEITIGRVVTLISKDVYSIDGGISFLKDAIIGVLNLLVVTYTLYRRVGISAFPAIGVIFVIIPLQLFLGKKTAEKRIETAKKTDIRFRLIKETLNAIKIIKMYTWQNYFQKIIHAARLIETDKIKIVYYLKSFIVSIGASTINLSFYILLISYIASGYPIEAEIVYFVQQSLFTLKITIASSIPMGIAQTADMMAAVHRIQTFLEAEEIKPKENINLPTINPKVHLNQVKVSIKGQKILDSVSLNLQQGLLLVTGPIGSGKSVLLKSILGEYPVSGGEMIVKGTFSYATEEPWLFPSTIRQNILFGQPFDEKRYQEVLHVCALTYDINQFEKLDFTIVGDRGINLSKGQQARIALARAVYKDSDIYLLDDCLSSLDNHVNNHIFKNCIKGFLKNKLCILVSNNISNIKSMKNKNILLIENGGTLTLQQQEGELSKRITYYIDEDDLKRRSNLREIPENLEIYEDDVKETDKLLKTNFADNEQRQNLYYEKNKEGGVLRSDYMRYYRFIGGLFVSFYLFVVFSMAQFCLSYSEKLISLWVNLEPKITTMVNNNNTNTVDYEEAVKKRDQFFNIYTILILGTLVLFLLRSYSNFFFCMNGARKLHNAMISAMLHTRMYFFDTHFIGNIINRLSKDFHAIDEYLPFLVFEGYRLVFSVSGVIILVASVNVWFFLPAAILLANYYWVQRYYLSAGRSLRRLEASTRSPIIGYLNSALEGLAVARAAEQEGTLKVEFDRHQDLYTSAYYINQTTMRFFGMVLDLIGTAFIIGIIFKIVWFPQGAQAGDVGLAISQAMALSGIVQYAIRQIAEVESVMTSVERVFEYADAELEAKTGKVLVNWPTHGAIEFKNVSLTYKSDGNRVLNNINFQVEERSKIGIVGRTGAGKSSIISLLFKLYDYQGGIFIDKENIKTLSLDFLRSSISIIPQDPILFYGTVRTNIDPYHKYSDVDIWLALEKVHMKTSVKSLNQEITDSNANYSSGQKQLLCLARAIVRKNKIVILDEATANLDPETDLLLQETVQECFKNCTVLTIAHRLNSVMSCDKVLVLDAGKIVEFDKPAVLLENKNGVLYKMVLEENFEFLQ